MPPQGEGFNAYASFQAYQQQQQQPQLFQTAVPVPQYTPRPQDMSYLASSNPSPRSATTTKYSPSLAPQTSAERRSLSDEEDDSDSDESSGSGASSGGSATPLPPYAFSTPPAPQQVSFEAPQSAQPAEQGEFVCDDCGVSYSRAPDLRRHKATVHNDKDSREKVLVHTQSRPPTHDRAAN